MNPSTIHDVHLNASPLARLQASARLSSVTRILTALTLSVTLAFLITPVAEAKQHPKAPTETPDPVPAGMLKVVEVDAVSISVAVGTSGTTTQSYSITGSTKVIINGAPAFARDLKAGMLAKIEPSADSKTAVTITAQDAVSHPGKNRAG